MYYNGSEISSTKSRLTEDRVLTNSSYPTHSGCSTIPVELQAIEHHLHEQLQAIITQIQSSRLAETAPPVSRSEQLTDHQRNHISQQITKLNMLPCSTQFNTVTTLLQQVTDEVHTTLTNKSLSSDTVTALKTTLPHLENIHATLLTAAPLVSSDIKEIQQQSATTLIPTYPNYNNNSIIANNSIVNGSTTAYNTSINYNLPDLQSINPLSQSFLNQCDLPTKVEYLLLWMADGPITTTMKNYSNQVIALGNNSNTINSFNSMIGGVATFFQQNQDTLGNQPVNLFQALAYYQSPSSVPNANQATRAFAAAMAPGGCLNAFYQQLTGTIDEWNSQYPDNQISSERLAQGGSLQQSFMQYFVTPVNNAAAAIAPNSSANLICNSDWWISSSGLYQSQSSSGSGEPFALTFTPSNVVTYIGNNTPGTQGQVESAIQNIQVIAGTVKSSLQLKTTYYGNLFNSVLTECNSVMTNSNTVMNTVINNISS